MLPNYQARSLFVLKHITSMYYYVCIDGSTSGVLEHKWRASLKVHYCWIIDFNN